MPDGVEGLYAAPVEFDAGTDAVCPAAEDDNAALVVLVTDVMFRAAVGEVEVVGVRGVFGGERVYLLDRREDAAPLPVVAHGERRAVDVAILLQADGAGYLEVGEALAFGLI